MTSSASRATPRLAGRALLLEDNAIIAMDAEAQLLDLGAETVDLATHVDAALDLLAAHAYSFALLDVHVGETDSRLVAEALTALGVPHAYATGRSDVPWAQEGSSVAPVLTKPLDPAALEDVIRQLCVP